MSDHDSGEVNAAFNYSSEQIALVTGRCPQCGAEMGDKGASYYALAAGDTGPQHIIDGPECRRRRLESVLRLFAAERTRQDAKWGCQQHEPLAWLAVLAEEFGELAMAVTKGYVPPLPLPGARPVYDAQIKRELVQVAAVCAAWLEQILSVEVTPADLDKAIVLDKATKAEHSGNAAPVAVPGPPDPPRPATRKDFG